MTFGIGTIIFLICCVIAAVIFVLERRGRLARYSSIFILLLIYIGVCCVVIFDFHLNSIETVVACLVIAMTVLIISA